MTYIVFESFLKKILRVYGGKLRQCGRDVLRYSLSHLTEGASIDPRRDIPRETKPRGSGESKEGIGDPSLLKAVRLAKLNLANLSIRNILAALFFGRGEIRAVVSRNAVTATCLLRYSDSRDFEMCKRISRRYRKTLTFEIKL